MDIVFFLLISLFLAYTSVRKYGALSAISVHVIYCFICMIAISFVYQFDYQKSDFYFTAMPMPHFDNVISTVLFLYTIIIFAPLFLYEKNSGYKKYIYKLDVNYYISLMFNNRIFYIVIFISSFLFFIANVFHFYNVKFDVLWSNTNYLSIKTPEDILKSELFVIRFHNFSFRYIGLLFFFMSACAYVYKKYAVALVCFLSALYPFVFLLAGNSRWSVLYIAVCLTVISFKKNPVCYLLLIITVVITMLKVLIGRELYYHGLNHIFDFTEYIDLRELYLLLISMFINVFEGAMNFANTLLNPYSFEFRYKLLSFSPLFSAIDGFDSIRDIMKFKWAPHVPMSAISESYSFGLFYFCSLFFVYLYLMFLIDFKVREKNAIIFYLVFPIFIYISFGLHTYSIRTFWKLILFMIVFISIILKVYDKKNI